MTPGEGSALELAARRLERAVTQLEHKLAAERAAHAAPVAGAEPGLFDAPVADAKATQLAADLAAARAREKALEEAGEQASEALGRAIAEIRAALGDDSLLSEGVHDDEEDEGAEQDEGDLGLFDDDPDDDGLAPEREA